MVVGLGARCNGARPGLPGGARSHWPALGSASPTRDGVDPNVARPGVPHPRPGRWISGPGELALVMGGGGARAAYQVGFLRCIARDFPELRPRS